MITAGIASLVEREESLKEAIESIYNQVDKIILVLNNYKEVPSWVSKLEKIKPILSDNRFGGSAKFLEVDKCEGYYFGCDDDLTYPEGYVEYMIKKIHEYRCVVSLNGKIFRQGRILSYAKDRRWRFNCYTYTRRDLQVQIPGTGVSAFNTEDLKISIKDFPYINICDIQMAIACKKQGVKVMLVAHPAKYVKFRALPGFNIHDFMLADDRIQTKLINAHIL